jgi:hypothetical protein
MLMMIMLWVYFLGGCSRQRLKDGEGRSMAVWGCRLQHPIHEIGAGRKRGACRGGVWGSQIPLTNKAVEASFISSSSSSSGRSVANHFFILGFSVSILVFRGGGRQ